MSQAAVSKPTPGKRRASGNLAADTFSKSIVILGCLILLQRGVGFLRSFYVCGALTPAEVGRWDLAFSFLMMAAPLAVLGIPGSFGRYVPKFETGGQHRIFLRHTLIACLLLTAIACGMIIVMRATVAEYFFGDLSYSPLVGFLALGLPLVVFFNFANSWLTGKRLNRVVFRSQFTQTLSFAILCLATFQLVSVSAESVVASYLGSCLAGLSVAAWCVACKWDKTDSQSVPEHQQSDSIWRKILPFAIWVWTSNVLMNLFSLCDRMLLVNFYPDAAVEIQFLVGQYHTACLFPLLLLSIGGMAGSMLIPYLSKDWEADNLTGVTDRMNLMLKGIGGVCLLGSIVVMCIAPVLFGEIWKNKFALGESLLPLTLSFCSLAAVTLVAQKYFWCIEETWISTALLSLGLTTNFVLGFFWIGNHGLAGVVASTLAAHVVVLVCVLVLCRYHGLKIDGGVYLIGIALFSVCFGPIAASSCCGILIIAVLASETLISANEKKVLLERVRRISTKVLGTNP